jgi:hypothetical protein
MDFREIMNDLNDFDASRILYRGQALTDYYTHRNEQKMIIDKNIVYYMMKYPNLELIESFINTLRENTDMADEYQAELFELDIIKLFSSTIMYDLATTEHLYIFMEIFGKDGFRLLYQIYDNIPLEFVDRKVVFDDYFTLGKIKRLFDKFDIIDVDEIKQLFKYLEPMSGLTAEEYLGYISSISESVSVPSRILQMIYDMITK